MNNWVTVKGHTVSLEIEQESERGLGFIYVKHCCIYRSSLKRFPAPFRQFPLLHFQLALNGWSNAIRSNYSSHVRLLSVCPRLRTDTHSSDGKVRQNSVQLLISPIHPSIFPPIHPLTGLHPSSTVLGHSCSLCSCILLPASPPAFSWLPLCNCTLLLLFNHFSSLHTSQLWQRHSFVFVSVHFDTSQSSFLSFHLLIRLSTPKRTQCTLIT